MANKESLSNARQQLEDLYLGIPDDSVDLTLKDLASYQREEPKVVRNMEPIREERSPGGSRGRALNKVPSIDFALAVEEAREHHRRVEQKLSQNDNGKVGSKVTSTAGAGQQMFSCDVSRGYGVDHSQTDERGGGRRRPGIPHSNLCALCSDYIYVFRHRCLVCGRVYCRKCVGAGMGEMTEGRKCVECLGRRFSQRYIQKAGQAGCCWRYPSTMKQQELKWAEKGPRRSGERRYGRSGTVSRSQSPVMPGTPKRSYVNENPPSFAAHSPKPFTPNPHGFPI